MKSLNKIINKKECLFFITIVLIDLISKVCANIFLPFRENVFLIKNKIALFLIYNEGSTGGQANILLQHSSNKNLTLLLSCCIFLVMLAYIFFIRKQKLRKLYKILIGIGLFFFLNTSIEWIFPYLLDIKISSWTTSALTKLTVILIFLTILYFTKAKWVRLSLIIVLAGGIGNLISHFYPPFRVIDFIYIEGLYKVAKIGVFNLADLVVYIGFISLIISCLSEFFMGLIRKRK